MLMDRYLAAVLSVLLLFGSHYFPWRGLLRRELFRTESYIIGTLCLFVPAVLTLEAEDAINVTVVVLSGGACVLMTHFIDYVMELRHRVIEATLLKEHYESEDSK